jgi:hypothetical protein
MAGNPTSSAVAAPLAAPRGRHTSGCGHHVGDRPRLISVRLAVQQPNQLWATLSLHSIAGGDRTLSWEPCPVCRWAADYVYQASPDTEPGRIGQDPEIVQSALLALLSQPQVDVFTLVGREQGASPARAPLATFVVPRHQLPIFELEPDRGR